MLPKGIVPDKNGTVTETYPECIQAHSKSVEDRKTCHTFFICTCFPVRQHEVPCASHAGTRWVPHAR
eukprot:611552-Karenia_brevis.AAC.1